jgi:beta-mannosidase
LQPTSGASGALVAVLVDAQRARREGTLTLSRRRVTGEILASVDVHVTGPAGNALRVPVPERIWRTDRPEAELVVADLTGSVGRQGNRAIWWFLEDAELDLPTAELTADVRPRPGGYDVEIRAHSIVRELCLFADRLDPAAQVDQQLLTLLPGERAVLRVDLPHASDRDVRTDRAALTSPPILRATNDARVHRARLHSDPSHRLVGADRKGTLS